TTFPKKVAPGETVDITMSMKTPDTKGTYKGYWLLRDEDDVKFGLGYGTKTPIEVKIKVVNAEAVHSYDFAANFCNATWKTDAATLYCDGNSAIYKDTVKFANNFQLENNKWEDEPAILVNVSKEERVRGIYPAYLVQPGDHFVTQTGCVEGSMDCKMEMRVLYQVKGGSGGVLDEWIEKYDGKLTLIDIDLSTFAGQEVYLTLDMESKSTSSQNEIFWFVPSIRNP
ncbi:MAG: NBR1-Ig-like domain-containing protein, partial [Anaerolineales bacterium]